MFIVPICTVSVNFRCKPFPYNAESFSLLYYINKKTHLTRCDLVCFADPRSKSTASGFTKKLFCLLQFDLVRKIALQLGREQSLPRKKPKSFV